MVAGTPLSGVMSSSPAPVSYTLGRGGVEGGREEREGRGEGGSAVHTPGDALEAAKAAVSAVLRATPPTHSSPFVTVAGEGKEDPGVRTCVRVPVCACARVCVVVCIPVGALAHAGLHLSDVLLFGFWMQLRVYLYAFGCRAAIASSQCFSVFYCCSVQGQQCLCVCGVFWLSRRLDREAAAAVAV